ncbi:hypothetical protein [Streptomyces sp. 4F14]|uniref:hypothetical protein n=1 Tax=Streptomyces sp. 4F14 TaxID=3394380 RepID=UPI003A89B70F
MNDKGQVVGLSATKTGGRKAFLWSKGRMRKLPLDDASAIDDRGQVSGGRLHDATGFHAARWDKGKVTDLGALGGSTTRLVAINDRNQILAESQLANGQVHPALWQRGRWTDLAAKGITTEGEVVDINCHGTIAASIRPVFGISHAVLYRKTL